jgi:hypothetical protein
MCIGLRINGVAKLLCHFGAQICHCALDLPQEPSNLVFLLGASMELVALTLALALALAVALAVALALVLRLLLVLACSLTLVGTITIWGLILIL